MKLSYILSGILPHIIYFQNLLITILDLSFTCWQNWFISIQ